MTVRAGTLPRLRDQMIRHLTEPGTFFGEYADTRNERVQTTVEHLKSAKLTFVTRDMAALAVHAGGRLEELDWSAGARPSPTGMIVFDGGACQTFFDGRDVPIDAFSWGTHDGECVIALWFSRDRISDEVLTARVDPISLLRLTREDLPPLLPINQVVAEPWTWRADTLDDGMRTPLATLNAAWRLMQQTNIVEATPAEIDPRIQRSFRRADRPAPEVTIIDLRRQYRTDQDPADRRTLTNWRWTVDGHWRNQSCGPGRTDTRRIWIADYLKGPDDAPILTRKKVNVWRR